MNPSTRPTRIGLTAVAFALSIVLGPTEASAQHRGHPGGGGRGAVVVGPPVYLGYGYGYGYGYYDPFWFGYGGWSPYGWYAPFYLPNAYDSNVGSARLQVKPRNAEVYVDGYYAGTVDDFDGALQRLDVPSGEHQLTMYLDGHRTVTQNVLFRRGATLNIKYEMQPLAAGEIAEPRPEAPVEESRPPQRGRPAQPAPAERRGDAGTLAIRVQPGDATLLVDGQEWSASEGSGAIRIELHEGSHEIEIRKEGFVTFRKTVKVAAGDTTSINVSLSR